MTSQKEILPVGNIYHHKCIICSAQLRSRHDCGLDNANCDGALYVRDGVAFGHGEYFCHPCRAVWLCYKGNIPMPQYIALAKLP